MRSAVLLVCTLGALSLSCGGAAPKNKAARPIDVLRERAAEQPTSKDAWLALAVAEHVEDGGEPQRAREALARAKQLGVSSIRLSYVEAEQHVLEARPNEALAALLRVLTEAPGSRDPLAPWLAESAFSGLADMNDAVDDYRPRVAEALKALAPKRAQLGLTAAHALAMQELTFGLQAGDLTRAQQATQAAGCVQAVDVAGPFGPRELLGFDTRWPAEQPGPLAAEYDLGPGRGVRPTRHVETRRCVLAIGRGAHDALPGTSIVRAEVEAKQEGAYALRVESPNSFVLYVDDQEVLRADMRKSAPFGVRYLPLQLKAGKHQLKLKVSSRHPNPVLSLALVKAEAAAVEATALPKADSPLARYLAAKLALSRGDAVSARELIRGATLKSPSAHWLVLDGAVSLADPLRTREQRRDRARDVLRRAAQANDKAWYPAVGLANLEAAEGRTKEAIDSLRAATQRYPDAIAIQTTLSEHLRQRGYVEEADRLLETLQKRLPHACAVVGLSLASARARGRVAEVERLMEQLLACDATSNARFALYRAQRKYELAAQELIRLRALAEPMDESQQLESELEHARLLGDVARERTLREQRSKLWHDRPEPVLDHADQLLAKGDRKEAIAYLAKTIQDNPDTLLELTRVQEALGGADLFQGFRKNGAEVIKSFEAQNRSYAEPEVLVLDYTVVRIFPDGSSADLTHNVLRMQSQEAVDRNGEFAVPENARLLSLHTVKADGRRLEPDPIPEKSTWSLPTLSLGDYVEFETIRGESPSLGFPGGYLGNRFYFKSFEIPFDHTELVVVLPPGMEPVIDVRGDAPKMQRETRDGLTILRWAEHESRPLREEPGSVATREYVPSINIGIKASWPQYVESLRDLLSDKDIADPEATAMVQKLVGDAQTPSERAKRIYRFVTDQIDPTDDVFGQAPAMLSARTGSRERVLKYLLGLAGIESELVLLRGAEADHQPAKLPDPETYGYLALRVVTEQGHTWLHAGARHAPFGYLPPQIRGEEGLLLNANAERVQTPAMGAQPDKRDVDVSIALDKDGKASISVRETHYGQSAVAWRNDLDDVPQAELSARFEESYASNVIPGEQLDSVEIEQRDDPEAPLVLAYKLTVDSFGHRVGDELRIPGLFPASLQGQFAREAERTTTALIAPGVYSTVQLHLALPKGAKLKATPREARLSFGKSAQFQSTVKRSDDDVTVTRSLTLPMSRVGAGDYAEFAGFCRAVDLAEASELAVSLP